MEFLLILLPAVALDLLWGEPPSAVHPVVGMGKVISFWEKGGSMRSHTAQFLYGLVMTLVTAGLFVVPAYFILFYLKNLSFIAYIVFGAVLLKSTFSLRGLRRAAGGVNTLLQADKLDEARFELRALVSRDTGGLAKPLLASAAVESVAESACDSIVAPLFYFLVFGVPGAITYRAVNTMDAMIGYHGKYEYLGKFAARADDVLNYIPARVAALLLILSSFLTGKDGRAAWRVAFSEHRKTASPNAGWPMAAVAGALGVQLEKVGYYQLGEAGRPPAPDAIEASLNLTTVAGLVWVLICSVIGVIYFVLAA